MAKVLEFQLHYQSSNEYSGQISLRIDSLELLAVQGALKILHVTVQKHQFFGHSAFFIVQISYPYMTTGKTISLIRWTFVGKVMSLLLNMLSRLVTDFLPRSNHLLISWLLSPSAETLEPKKLSVTVSAVSLSLCHELMRADSILKSRDITLSTKVHLVKAMIFPVVMYGCEVEL